MQLAPPFSDHAVLQRDQPIPVWGRAGPDQEVTVTLAGRCAYVISSADGSWLVRLPALPAGGPHQLVARSASGEACANDVLIGEVWICSGQSNMDMRLQDTGQGLDAAASDLPGLRLLTVGTPARQGRQSAIDGRWLPATQTSLERFSAVGAWFGRALHLQLGVPVGMICNAWGGSRIQAWLSRDALLDDALGRDDLASHEESAFDHPGTTLTPGRWEIRLRTLDSGNAGLPLGWARPDCDDSAWPSMRLAAPWQAHGHAGNGVVWFRRTITLPAAWTEGDLALHLGTIDKHDDTYVNGERVGGLSWDDGPETWRTPRCYRIPARLAAGGSVTIAVRVRSHAFHGGMTGPDADMRLHPLGRPEAAIPLHGDWRYRVEQDWGVNTPPSIERGAGFFNAPGALFDSRLAPLIPYGVRGFAWYQGEGNAHEAAAYRRFLPLLISDWRRAFANREAHFLVVQLPRWAPVASQPGESGWAAIREAQLAALADPRNGLAIAIDLGEAEDVHPTDKRPIGERLARWALAQTYGLGGVPAGPLFRALTAEAGGWLRCCFDHAAGLRTRDGAAPRRVAIAGLDRVFVWAESTIDGETLVAWSAQVPRPVALRYAWADNPEGCNLVNGEDLPASPFRTDTW